MIRSLRARACAVIAALAIPAFPAGAEAVSASGQAQEGALVTAARDTAALELPSRNVKVTHAAGPGTDMPARDARKLPGAMDDPVRALATTPGVETQSDVNARPFVRGGDAEMTRVILDGIPLLQPYHAGGSFSLFDLNTLASSGLYRDAFPAEYPGALSGILRLKAKGGIPRNVSATGDLSLVRGDAYLETPILPGRLGAFASAQTLVFADAVHGALDLASASSGDPAFKADMRGYRDHVNLPSLTDWHWGAVFAPSESFHARYQGLAAGDGYAVVVPHQSNILTNLNPNLGNPSAPVNPQPSQAWRRGPGQANKLSVDSISDVDIRHRTHILALDWDAAPGLEIENDFGWQTQDWEVGFKTAPGASAPWALSQSLREFDWRGRGGWRKGDHDIAFGAAYAFQKHRFDMKLPWVLYDVIVDGNMDMLAALGEFSRDGFTIAKADSGLTNLDYLGEYPSRLRFAHKGSLEQHSASLFAADTWTAGRGTLSLGVRAQYHSLSEESFPAPRGSFAWRAGGRDELRATAGVYSQDNLPFYERDGNPSLRSEKCAQAGLGWTHRFGKAWKASLEGYYKRYEDLVVARLVPDGTLDLDGFLLPLPETSLTEGQQAALASALDTTREFSSLPDSLQQLAYAVFGGLEYEYANTGSGNGLGAELSLEYAPTPGWKGWASVAAGTSDRRDAPGENYYPYRYHRPIVCNWANRFAITGGYELALAYRWALGQPYTEFSGEGDGRGSFEPIVVGGRNRGRLSSYSRLDLRLSRLHKAWGVPFRSYIEVWNATNSPNYFARDAETGRLRAAQLNWPFPFLFLGVTGNI